MFFGGGFHVVVEGPVPIYRSGKEWYISGDYVYMYGGGVRVTYDGVRSWGGGWREGASETFVLRRGGGVVSDIFSMRFRCACASLRIYGVIKKNAQANQPISRPHSQPQPQCPPPALRQCQKATPPEPRRLNCGGRCQMGFNT